MNFYADRDINFEAGRNINIKSAERYQTEVGTNFNLIIGENGNITTAEDINIFTAGDNKFTAGGDTSIKSGGDHLETASQIHMNGPQAAIADVVEELPTFVNLDNEETVIDSIMLRIPSHEPWPYHENLDPLSFKPEMTDREAGSDIEIPQGWKEYSTTTDTFAKIKGSEE